MASAEKLMRIEVVYCPVPGQNDLVVLRLGTGATVADALAASSVIERHGLAGTALRVGIWSKVCEHSALLRDRDRVEIYRPLTVDPKEARRVRYKSAKDRAKARANSSAPK